MSDIILNKLCVDKTSKNNVLDFFKFISEKNPSFEQICNEYYLINKSWIDLDMREKRNIGDIAQIRKNCMKEYHLKQDKIKQLGENINKGYGLTGILRNISEDGNESILTIFESGKVVKYQDPDGINFILPKGKTLMFKYNEEMIVCDLIDTKEAEKIDDEQPLQYSFIDSSGAKHESKFIYSKKFHTEFYQFMLKYDCLKNKNNINENCGKVKKRTGGVDIYIRPIGHNFTSEKKYIIPCGEIDFH